MMALFTGLLPLFTKMVERISSKYEKKADQDFELEKLKTLTETQANAEVLKAQAEVSASEYSYETERVKSLASMQSQKTGIKWIDASINLVRALFGYGAVGVFLSSAFNLWLTGSPLLTQAEFSETFFAILFYFFAERSCKKAFGKD